MVCVYFFLFWYSTCAGSEVWGQMTKSPCPIVKSQEELIQVNLVFFKVGSASTVPQEEISKEQIKERKTPKSNVLSNPSGGAAFAFVCVSLRLSLVFVDSGGTTTRNCFDQNGVLRVVEASLVALRRSVEHIGISQVPQSLPVLLLAKSSFQDRLGRQQPESQSQSLVLHSSHTGNASDTDRPSG